MRRRALASIAILVLALVCRLGHAQSVDDPTRSAARALGQSGVDAYLAGDYVTASRRLEQSFQLLPVPSLGLWSAKALRELGLLREARERLEAVEQLPIGSDNSTVQQAAVQQAAKAEAKRVVLELARDIPHLRIEIEGAGVADTVVWLDETVLTAAQISEPIAVNPGRHEIMGKHADELSEVSLTLAAGQQQSAVLRFAGAARPPTRTPASTPASTPQSVDPAAAPREPPASRAHPWRTAAWVAIGVGGAGIATGVLAYVIGLGSYHDLPAGCRNGGDCPPSDALDNYDTTRWVHGVSLVAGGVLGAAGLSVLLLVHEPEGEIGLSLGPAGAQLHGSF